MEQLLTASIIEYFFSIPAPRIERGKKHKLIDIFITLGAVIAGADGWVSVSEYGKAKPDWLTKVLGLENGIPSHDIFGNVFAMIDTEQLPWDYQLRIKWLTQGD